MEFLEGRRLATAEDLTQINDTAQRKTISFFIYSTRPFYYEGGLMSDIIVVTSPTLTRNDAAIRREETLIAQTGGRVLASVRHGTVASGSPAIAEAMQKK